MNLIKASPGKILNNMINVGLRYIRSVFTAHRVEQNGTSLARVADIARVEPVTVVEKRLTQHESITDVLETTLNLYTAIYMQAVALTNSGVNKVQVITRLGQLSSKGANVGNQYTPGKVLGQILSTESIQDIPVEGVVSEMIDEEQEENLYKDGLPSAENYANLTGSVFKHLAPALENKREVEKIVSKRPAEGVGLKEVKGSTGVREIMKDAVNLVIGKVVDVTLNNDGEEVIIPVSISLATTEATSGIISDILISAINNNETALERKIGFSSGRLSFIKDILFGNDVIRRHRKSLIQDKNGVRSRLEESKVAAREYTLNTGKVSLAYISNVIVTDRLTIDMLEAKTGYSLDNFTQRNKLLLETGVMLLVVVDDEAGMTSFYIDGVKDPTTVPTRSLKSSNKKNGNDLTDFFKAIVRGDSPRL